MPPLWVFAVGVLVLIGSSKLIFMKIGESVAASQVQAFPVSASPASTRPLD